MVDDGDLELVLQQVEVVLHPLLALGLDVLVDVELDFVLAPVHVLLPDVVLVCELLQPHRTPRKAEVPQQAHRICISHSVLA